MKWKRVYISIIAVLMFLSMTYMIRAQEEMVRVGFFEMNGFHEYDDKGNHEGYGVDYLNKISGQTGWKYEYISIESWHEGVDLLRRGEIDLLAPSEKTLKREEEFSFSSFSIGSECGALMTGLENYDLVYEEFNKFSDIQIGYVEESVFEETFLRYAEKNEFTPHLVAYKTQRELLQALESKSVDAIVTNLFVKTSSMKVLGKFGAAPFYYMTSKQNIEFLEELDEAIRMIKMEEPEFEVELLNYYYPEFNQTPYTEKELAYIAKKNVFRIGCVSNKKPISFVDEETGEIAGITREIFDRISQNSGLTFEYVPLPDGNITYDYLRENQISLVASVEYNAVNMNAPGMRLTLPYLNAKKVFVCKSDLLFDKERKIRLAMATGSQTIETMLKEKYAVFEICRYETIEDCFKAVRTGEADMLLENQYVAEYYLTKPLYMGMNIVPAEGLEDEHCLSPVIYQEKGILDETLSDERLISVLNKAIRRIDEEEISKIIIYETNNRNYKYTLKDALYMYRHTIVVAGITFLMIIGILCYVIQLKRKNMAQTIKSEIRLRNITNNINGGVVVLQTDENMKITYANEGFLELLQYKKEEYNEIQKDGYMTYVHPKDAKVLQGLLKMEESDGKKVSVKLHLRKRDGEYVPTLFNGTITKNVSGEKELYCVIMDITERERLFDALTMEQEKHNFVIENSGDILFEVDRKNRTFVLNHVFEQKFGRMISPILPDKSIEELVKEWGVHKEDQRKLQEMIEALLEKTEREECVIRIQKEDETYLWCRVKGYSMYNAEQKVSCIVGKILDIDGEVKEKQALKEKSRLDGLTGLVNKETFFHDATEYLNTHDSMNAAIIFIDIDNFKMVNDKLGHMMGDEAIQKTAERIQAIVPGDHLLARFGGDEFCILLKRTTLDELKKKLSQLVKEMYVTYENEKGSAQCSASVGAVFHRKEEEEDMDVLIRKADQAVYYAKEHGKNQFALYGEFTE